MQRLSATLEELETLADALDQRIRDHDQASGSTGILAIWVNINIAEYAETEPDRLSSWQWKWHDSDIISRGYRSKVEKDGDLEVLMFQYARARRLLLAYREAFIHTMAYLQDEESAALLANARAQASGRIRRWRAQRSAQDRIEASKVWADAQAVELVANVERGPV
ncbi:hypothetical protein D8M34_06000 [Microbacterium sp. HSID17254]|nr:hypothetical protein D8M34_06000 [Microbacterium sp. HSID17254]